MPAKLDRCVEEVKNDPNVDNPFAVCQAAINKSGKGFKTLSECVQANIGIEKDPVGYCQMKFPNLQNNTEDLATAKMLVAIAENVSIVDKKKKKKTDIHLLLNTPLEGSAHDLEKKVKGMKSAQLTMTEEIKIKKMQQEILEKRINKVKEELVVKMDLKKEVEGKIALDPENKPLKQEMDRLESDIEFAIGDLVRNQKELMGEPQLATAKHQFAMAGINTAKLKTGSLIDAFDGPAGEKFVTYFLINAKENLKGWGVTEESIPRHIGSFKDMPFTITSNKFFAKSPYGEDYDHPDTRHFAKLGITRPRSRNDMMQQALFQEEFRVGNIDEIFNKGDDWFAFIRILPKFADMEMPPLISPAIFQLNEAEPEDRITQWIGMHMTGLDEKPAYGNDALFKGSCFGDKQACLTQLTAKNTEPCFRGKFANVAVEFAKARLKLAAQISSDNLAIQAKPLLCRKDGKLQACPQSELKRGQTKAVVIAKKERRSKY